jgi:hypothetical protein
MLCVFDGRRCVGFIMPGCRGCECRGCEAFDVDGHSLGVFPTADAAAAAVRTTHTKESAG